MPYPPPVARTGALERFRAALLQTGYTETRVSRVLDMTTFPTPGSAPYSRALFRTRAGEPFDIMLRLFLLGVPQTEEALRGAMDPALLFDLGLAHADAGQVVPHFTVLEMDGLYLVCDPPAQLQPVMFSDTVNGPTDPTAALERFLVHRRSRLTLDLGTGCGYLALKAAGWSDAVVAADINARALDFTVFNSALNGVPVEGCVGDLFVPLQDRRFDLILSNPPFLITPGRTLVYRDGGMAGDGFARRVVREAVPLMAEGGLLQMVFEWIHPKGEDAKTRLASWFDGLPCDAIVFHTGTLDPVQYAEERIAATQAAEHFDATFQQWLEFYREQQIEAISTGYLAMRRRSGESNWFRIDDLDGGLPENFGPAVERRFAVADLLRERGDDALLSIPLRVAPQARLLRVGAAGAGGFRVDRRELSLGCRGVGLNGSLEQFLAMLDGRTLVARILEQMENGDAAARQLRPFLRDMVEQGFLLMDPQVN